MFTQFDKDRDGLLDVSDLGPLLRSMGPSYNPSEKELEELKLRFLPLGKIKHIFNAKRVHFLATNL